MHLYEFFLILTIKERKINVKLGKNELKVKGMFNNEKLTCCIFIYMEKADESMITGRQLKKRD